MNKSQLIKAVAEKSELSQKQIGETWKLFEQTILETLNAGDKVQLSGFGTFEVRERAERKGQPQDRRGCSGSCLQVSGIRVRQVG